MDPTSKPPPQAYISREEFFFHGEENTWDTLGGGCSASAAAAAPRGCSVRDIQTNEQTYRQTDGHRCRVKYPLCGGGGGVKTEKSALRGTARIPGTTELK